MGYRFGQEEELYCIQDVSHRESGGEPLCLAYKTTTINFLAPVYFRDDGYVLADKTSLRTQYGKQYYAMPEGARLHELQASGDLPSPLPAYRIPAEDYFMGFGLWWILAGTAAVLVGQEALKRRRARSLLSQQPPSIAAPTLRTKADRWLAAEATKLAEGNEAVQHQAYGYNTNIDDKPSIMVRALFLVLTDRRLIIIGSRVGNFGPLLENDDVRSVPRAEIAYVERDERHLRFVLHDGEQIDFYAVWRERHLSNQRRFLSDVPRLLGAQPVAAAS